MGSCKSPHSEYASSIINPSVGPMPSWLTTEKAALI